MLNPPNYLWFILLAALSVSLLFYKFFKDRNHLKKNLSVYFLISGLSFLLEFVVLICFNAYSYFPNIFQEEWFDKVIGAFTSQAIAVPAVAVFLSAFRKNWKWILGAALLFMGIESLFLKLNIYTHHWWSTLYTGALLAGGFRLAQTWHKSMDNPGKFIKFTVIYLALNTFVQSLKYFMVVLESSHYYTTGVFSDPYRDSTFGSSVFLLIITALMGAVIVFNFRWYWVLLIIFVDWAASSWLIENDILHMGPGWKVSYFSLIFTGTLFLFRFLYLWMFDHNNRTKSLSSE